MLLISLNRAFRWSVNAPAACKAGYSLIEIMVVIAIMAVASAIAVPRAASALDQVISHTVFFEFQRQVSSLRAEAFRNERAVRVVEIGHAVVDGGVQPVQTATLSLRSGWTYKMSAPLLIDAGSSCSIADVDLFNSGRKIMHLESHGHDCRFIRTV
jgi:prepilin-type N-terminal cleavage/methylation domain-containing protein